jgi:predicted MPP superfamily phosphohydrolase
MREQVAVFTFGRSRNPSTLKERLATLFQRFAIAVFLLFLFFVHPCYYILYLVYFVLSMPAIEFVIAVLERAKLLRAETVCTPGFRFARLGCHLLIPALIVFAGAFNNNHPRVKEVLIELPRKSSTIRELNMVFASDFHLDSVHLDPVNDLVLDRFVAETNALHPDIILTGGDILDVGVVRPTATKLAEVKRLFRSLSARYGIYAIRGNHELSIKGIGHDFFVESGMKLLEDSVERIDNAFYLAGRQDADIATRNPIGNLLEAAPDDLPIILLDHQPTDLENVSRNRVDLQLSGHTHNGQLFPVNLLVTPLQYELAHGVKVKRNTLFIVSSGVHYSDWPVNTAGFSEILHIKAVFRSDIRTPKLRGRSAGLNAKLFR